MIRRVAQCLPARTSLCSAAAAALALSLGACKADGPKLDPSGKADAGGPETLDSPVIANVPVSTPIDTVAIEGSTDGTRIVIEGSKSGTLITTVLPGGNFCRDVPLHANGPTELAIYAAASGLLSDPVEVTVSRDPEAPMPPRATCGGENPQECAASEAVCDNERDDDCDGYVDQCDLDCSGCVDDAFEPNDQPLNVPSLLAGSYQLQICPCRDDWFAFDVRANDRIRATATFDNAQIDLELDLFRAGPEGSGTGTRVDFSHTTNNQEQIDYTAEEAGTYFLRIFPFGSTKLQGSYTLNVQ